MSNTPEAAELDPPAPVACEYCGALRYHKGLHLTNKVLWMPYGAESCTCPQAAAAKKAEEAEKKRQEEEKARAEAEERVKARIKRLIGESGMRERFLRRSFDTYQTPDAETKRAYKVAKDYADNFENKLPAKDTKLERNSLFISGAKGTGKTHLAAAIANQLISQGRAVICMTMIDLLARIKATYDKGQVSEGEVLKLYETVPLLIIDDMGKEQATEWGSSKIYAIINARYEAYMPTVITTNYDDKTLEARLTPPGPYGDRITAEATVDRLREMCSAIIMTGESWRSR